MGISSNALRSKFCPTLGFQRSFQEFEVERNRPVVIFTLPAALFMNWNDICFLPTRWINPCLKAFFKIPAQGLNNRGTTGFYHKGRYIVAPICLLSVKSKNQFKNFFPVDGQILKERSAPWSKVRKSTLSCYCTAFVNEEVIQNSSFGLRICHK